MNRRNFLTAIAGAATAAVLPVPEIASLALAAPELALNRDVFVAVAQFKDRYIRPAAEAIANRFDVLYGVKSIYPEFAVRIRDEESSVLRLKRSDWAHLDPARLPL